MMNGKVRTMRGRARSSRRSKRSMHYGLIQSISRRGTWERTEAKRSKNAPPSDLAAKLDSWARNALHPENTHILSLLTSGREGRRNQGAECATKQRAVARDSNWRLQFIFAGVLDSTTWPRPVSCRQLELSHRQYLARLFPHLRNRPAPTRQDAGVGGCMRWTFSEAPGRRVQEQVVAGQ